MRSEDKNLYFAILQLNNNMMALMKILQKMQRDGIRVVTQESHG